jgi:single-strand DNA-binding protein
VEIRDGIGTVPCVRAGYGREVNSIRLAGSLATDVDVRHYDDRRRASFLLRVARDGSRGSDFLPVVAWNANADACDRLVKGAAIELRGELRSRRWEDREGRKHRALEVVATRIEAAAPREEATMGS